jgi:hypothetical protein
VAGPDGSSDAGKAGKNTWAGSCQLLLIGLARFIAAAATDGRGARNAQTMLLAAAACIIKSRLCNASAQGSWLLALSAVVTLQHHSGQPPGGLKAIQLQLNAGPESQAHGESVLQVAGCAPTCGSLAAGTPGCCPQPGTHASMALESCPNQT